MITTLDAELREWAFTDLTGHVESVSPRARDLLRVRRLGRGDDLLTCFQLPRKAMMFDIAMAIAGWPARRTVVVDRFGGLPIRIHYWVSRRLPTPGEDEGLYWRLQNDHHSDRIFAA